MLRVDVRTVHRITASGHLPYAVKIPGRTGAYLFDPTVVEMFQRQRSAAA